MSKKKSYDSFLTLFSISITPQSLVPKFAHSPITLSPSPCPPIVHSSTLTSRSIAPQLLACSHPPSPWSSSIQLSPWLLNFSHQSCFVQTCSPIARSLPSTQSLVFWCFTYHYLIAHYPQLLAFKRPPSPWFSIPGLHWYLCHHMMILFLFSSWYNKTKLLSPSPPVSVSMAAAHMEVSPFILLPNSDFTDSIYISIFWL